MIGLYFQHCISVYSYADTDAAAVVGWQMIHQHNGIGVDRASEEKYHSIESKQTNVLMYVKHTTFYAQQIGEWINQEWHAWKTVTNDDTAELSQHNITA